MAKQKPTELLANLSQFTGTTKWWKHPLFPNQQYTDGVRYLAINAEAYWLIEYILSNQLDPKIKAESFQVWKIELDGEGADIKVEDGNDNVVKEFSLSFTTFPLENYTLWLVKGSLLLPSEY